MSDIWAIFSFIYLIMSSSVFFLLSASPVGKISNLLNWFSKSVSFSINSISFFFLLYFLTISINIFCLSFGNYILALFVLWMFLFNRILFFCFMDAVFSLSSWRLLISFVNFPLLVQFVSPVTFSVCLACHLPCWKFSLNVGWSFATCSFFILRDWEAFWNRCAWGRLIKWWEFLYSYCLASEP